MVWRNSPPYRAIILNFFPLAIYKLSSPIPANTKLLYEIGGLVFIFLVWFVLTMGENPIVNKGILPSPGAVWASFFEMLRENELFSNFTYSLGLNLGGYIEAIAVTIPLAMLIGLIPWVRAAFQRPVDSLRFLVLPAATGLFIAWFGIGAMMKINFLAFGIIIYLLPVAISRIDEVNDIYLQTAYTLGASKWQLIKNVYFPSVFSSLFSDIRILTAISWTYIIIAEAIGGEAGIGALAWRVGIRRGRIDKVFCLLIIIMLVGIFQDKLFAYLDKKLFPYKYQAEKPGYGSTVQSRSIFETISDYAMASFIWTLIVGYIVLVLDEYFGLLGHKNLLSYMFKDTLWTIHIMFILILWFQISSLLAARPKLSKAKATAK